MSGEVTDYERGFRDGVIAAGIQIAEHYKALKERGAQAVSDLIAANQMMHSLVLAELAPLQDRVNQLQVGKADGHG